MVRLLDRTLIRVGNDEYARENKSFGLTTLRRRHVQVDGATLRFTFRGKSGVEHSITLDDPRLARIIQRCQDLPGHELFQYLDAERKRQAITSDDVNAYLRELTGRDVTAKDFRTWGGTMLAAVELRAMGPAASRREADRNILRAIDAVPSASATRAQSAASTTSTRRCSRPTSWAAPCRSAGCRAPPGPAPHGRQRCAATRCWCCSSCRSGFRDAGVKGCELCEPKEVLFESEFAYVRYDSSALSKGHVIVVPRRHVAGFFDMSGAEQGSVLALLNRAKKFVDREHKPAATTSASTSVPPQARRASHVHVHLIPRYAGDPHEGKGVRAIFSRLASDSRSGVRRRSARRR